MKYKVLLCRDGINKEKTFQTDRIYESEHFLQFQKKKDETDSYEAVAYVPIKDVRYIEREGN